MKNWFLTTLAVSTLACSGVQAADNSTPNTANGAKAQQTKQHTGARVKAAHHNAKHHRHHHAHEYCNGSCCAHSSCGHHHHVEKHHHKNKQGHHRHHNRMYSNDYGYYNNSNPQDAMDNPEKTNR